MKAVGPLDFPSRQRRSLFSSLLPCCLPHPPPELSPWELGICGLPGVPDAKNKWTDHRMSRTWNPAATTVSLLQPTSISSLPPVHLFQSLIRGSTHITRLFLPISPYYSILRIYAGRRVSSKWKENNCTLKINLTLWLFTMFHLSALCGEAYAAFKHRWQPFFILSACQFCDQDEIFSERIETFTLFLRFLNYEIELRVNKCMNCYTVGKFVLNLTHFVSRHSHKSWLIQIFVLI